MRVALLLLIFAGTAVAQPHDGDPVAIALFDDGRELVARGELVRACEKFEAARQRVPWLGITLNLADCYERIGKTATAWALFRKAADDAGQQADPRASYARDRADKLEPGLSYVTITMRGVGQLRFDRQRVAPNTAFPVDPGEHVIDASASETIPWSKPVVVEPHGSIEVVVPPLERLVHNAIPAAPRGPSARARTAIALGATGMISVGASLVIALDAKLQHAAARSHCDASLQCDPFGFETLRIARRHGTVATITGGIGLGMLAAAVALYWSGSERQLVPIATPTTVGLGLQGDL